MHKEFSDGLLFYFDFYAIHNYNLNVIIMSYNIFDFRTQFHNYGKIILKKYILK